MKSNLIVLFTIMVFLFGCTPSNQAIQTAIGLTQAAFPTKTPMPPSATSTFTPSPSPIVTLTSLVPTPTPNRYFVEEFDQELGDAWSFEAFGPIGYDHTKVESKIEDSHLKIAINGNYFFAYEFFNVHTYQDVKIDLRAENRGVNNNSVTLICRKNEYGWFEFNVTSGGAWDLEAYISTEQDKGYHQLTSGGTLELKQGKEINEYTMICKDESVAMMINNIELKGSPYNLAANSAGLPLAEGQVGFSISSFNVTPVIVNIDWFKVSEP